jgi:uncharacterized protein with HEPN domain
MVNRIKQYLFDIEQSIGDVKSYISAVDSFDDYEKDKMIRRAVERELEIIGEAINRILKIDPDIKISNAKKIISLRNKIIHGYDDVDDVIIYTVATKHLDMLKKDIDSL